MVGIKQVIERGHSVADVSKRQIAGMGGMTPAQKLKLAA